MSSTSERVFYLMRLAMGRFPAVDASVTIEVLIDACEYAQKNAADIAWVVGNQVHQDTSGLEGSNAIYLADLRVDSRYVHILLVRGDPTVGRPTFANMKNKSVTSAAPDDPDAVPAFSALIVIERGVSAEDKGKHRAVLERAQGLGKGMVKEYFQVLLQRYSKKHPEKFQSERKVRNKKEKPDIISYVPTLKLHPQQNASLKGDLGKGQIGGFRLMRGEAKYDGPADEARIIRTNVSLQVKLNPTKDLKSVYKTLVNVRNAMSNVIDFDSYNLELLDIDNDESHNTQMMPLETIEANDMRYCRAVRVSGFRSELKQCYPEFHEEMVDKAKVFFSKAEYWK